VKNGNNSEVLFWDGSSWTVSKSFSGFPDSLGIYDGDLYVTVQNGEVWRYDGSSWTNPHTASSEYYVSFVVYNGNAYMANGNNASVTQYDGNTWDESFLQSGDFTFLSDGFPWGLCVFEGTLYLAVDDEGPPAHILSYDPTNGWQEFAAIDTSTQGSAGNSFNGFVALGSYDGTLVAGTQSGQFWTYDKQADTWNFQGTACSYLSSFHVWDGDLYMAGRFGFFESDGVWKWDGSTLTKDLDDSEFDSNNFNGPFRFANVWQGKLITYHRYVSDLFFIKGDGQEVRVPFDQSANELAIEAGTSEGTLNLNVNGTSASKAYDFTYDQDGTVRLGVDRGSVTGGETSNMDEPYTGDFKTLKRFPKLTDGLVRSGLEAASGPTVSSTGQTSSSVSGDITFGDPSIADEYEVVAGTSSGGPYDETVATFTETEVANLSSTESWTHDGLSSATTYYYVGRVTGAGKTVESSEISVTTT